MRASVPPKLWPLPGEVLPLTPEQRAARRSEAGTVPADVNYRFEPGGAAEWLAASWEDWLNDRPVWLTEEWRLGIPGHFLPAAARVPLPPLPAAVAAAADELKIAEFGAGRSGSV